MKRNKRFIVLMLVLFISIGFAVLSVSLNLRGTVGFESNTWNVYFDNISVIENMIGASNPTITNGTTLSFTGNFTEPSQVYSFSIDVINAGGIDAMFDDVEVTGNTDYFTISVTYYDGTSLTHGDILRMGMSKKIIITFEYNYDIDELPDSESLSTTLNINYTAKNVQDINYDRNVWNYPYSGYEQVFVVPKNGTYKIEALGAS